MGEYMKKKINTIVNIILPHKKINIFIISIIVLGVTAGAIFANIISINDQKLVIDKIKTFIDNINNGGLNSLIVLKNSLSINLIYTIIIWLLGMTLIGLIIVILLLFTKSFIFGFSIASFIITYKTKGIIISFLYLLFGQLLNIIAVLILTAYSITFTVKLFKTIFKNNNNKEILSFTKNYLIILVIVIVINIISSLSESFLLPALIKLIIKMYV